MAALSTAAWLAIASLVSTGAQMVDANQQRQKAKGEAGKIANTPPPAAPTATLTPPPVAGAKPRPTPTAGGRSGTLLTGPGGAAPTPTTRKTLLGL